MSFYLIISTEYVVIKGTNDQAEGVSQITKHSEPSDFSLVDGGFRPQDAGGSVRGACAPGWPAVADAELAEDTADSDGAAKQAPRLATSFENRVRRLRADAHAAFHSVEGARKVNGPDAAALDAALAVMEAEWRAIVAERDKLRRGAESDPGLRARSALPGDGGDRPVAFALGFERFRPLSIHRRIRCVRIARGRLPACSARC